MLNGTHPNSRKVTFFRTSSFMLDAQEEGAPEFASMASKSIGPYLILGSQQPGTGLEEREIKLLLPILIDAEPGERDFRTKVRTFFDCLYTRVPFGSGTELEIGLTEDNDKPLSIDNMPINVKEYIRYRHALKHPQVGITRDAAVGNSLKWFYLHDPVEDTKALASDRESKDEAMQEYLAISKDESKMDMLLTLLGEDPRRLSTISDKRDKLTEYATTKSEFFLKQKNVKDFELRYTVISLIKTGILKEITGGLIQDPQTNELLANSIDEMIGVMQKPENSGAVAIWKQKMQEALKQKIVSKPTQRKPQSTRR